MSVSLPEPARYSRDLAFTPSLDWALLIYAKIPVLPVGPAEVLIRGFGDPTLVGPYVALVCTSSGVVCRVYDGVTETDSTVFAASADTWYLFTLDYDGSDITFRRVNYLTSSTGSLSSVGAVTVDLSLLTFTEAEFIGGVGTVVISHERTFDNNVSTTRLTTESQYFTYNSLVNLVAAVNFQNFADVADHSGSANEWALTGSATTVTDPFAPLDNASITVFGGSLSAGMRTYNADLTLAQLYPPYLISIRSKPVSFVANPNGKGVYFAYVPTSGQPRSIGRMTANLWLCGNTVIGDDTYTHVVGITMDANDNLFALVTDNAAVPQVILRKYDVDLNFVEEWTTPFAGAFVGQPTMEVSADGTKLYYSGYGAYELLLAWDLENDVDLGTVVTFAAGLQPQSLCRTPDGNLLVGARYNSGAPFFTTSGGDVYHYDVSNWTLIASTINVYVGPDALGATQVHPDGNSFWVTGSQDIKRYEIDGSGLIESISTGGLLVVASSSPTYHLIFIGELSEGYTCSGVVPYPSTASRVIRRLRRFPLPFATSYWAFVSRLEMLMQTGDAPISGQGSDPVVTVRFSPDGGRTWGDLIVVPCGARGEYEFRPTVNRVGRFRNGLVEVSATDPLLWYWLDAFIDVEFGGA